VFTKNPISNIYKKIFNKITILSKFYIFGEYPLIFNLSYYTIVFINMIEKKTNLSTIKLPSNKKFGYFFSVIFLITATYFLYSSGKTVGYLLIILALVFFVTTFINAEVLYPLNKLWMHFGILIGKIISPVVLGFIFFGLFTPYSIIMRIMGRDELRLKKLKNDSYWILRSKDTPQTSFKRQF